MKKIAVMMLSILLLTGSLSNNVFAEENTNSCKIEQVKEEKQAENEKQKEIEELKEKNELLKLGIPSDIALNQWYPNVITKLPTKTKYHDKEKIDLSGMEIEFIRAIKTEKGTYEKVSEKVSFDKLKEGYRGWKFNLKTEVADLTKTQNGKMQIYFSFTLKNTEESMK